MAFSPNYEAFVALRILAAMGGQVVNLFLTPNSKLSGRHVYTRLNVFFFKLNLSFRLGSLLSSFGVSLNMLLYYCSANNHS